jgi:hypothetical protein
MTPKEKAEELYCKYDSLFKAPFKKHQQLKDCCLIAVNEIIQSRQDDGHFDDTLSSTGSEYYTPHPMYLTYWLQVKNEIENL